MDTRSKKDDDNEALPGFRFYPTDEELVGFYLKRKVEKRAISMELIKQIDIYKYDPWDLPKACTVIGDNEWYFYCKRGRKYRNSVRPNRVTGSGFWKATGIDKPVYSTDHQGVIRHEYCIGLKKSLVYYRGNAGKGTKTDWMMHEFRLPDQPNAKTNTLEAEVWTLCRIFKRSVSCRKYTSNWREISTKRDPATEASSKTCSTVESTTPESKYISFQADPFAAAAVVPQNDKKLTVGHMISTERPNQFVTGPLISSVSQAPFMAAPTYPNFTNLNGKNEFFTNDSWDELSSVLGFSLNPSYV